jgi:hypothetical protein
MRSTTYSNSAVACTVHEQLSTADKVRPCVRQLRNHLSDASKHHVCLNAAAQSDF